MSRDALSVALSAARERGRLSLRKICNEPDMLTKEQFATRAHITMDAVEELLWLGAILALRAPGRGYRFPDWQLDADGNPYAGLMGLHHAFSFETWSVYRFLVQTHVGLDGLTGLEALQVGKASAAISVAGSMIKSAK